MTGVARKAHSGLDSIPGTRSAERVEENVAAADLVLAETDLARIREILPTGGFGARYAEGMNRDWQ
jgi:aryl-alcohol dehydrogenase-like predicted oxidoreductase